MTKPQDAKIANDRIFRRVDAAFRHEFAVPDDAIDQNGHVNNVAYVQWMQDVAVRHFSTVGGVAAMHEAGATWVVRSHRIEYLSPAFAGDRIRVDTWVESFSRVRSLRRYRFTRETNGALLAQGETDWVFVDAETGRPCSIPEAIKSAFLPVPDPDRPRDADAIPEKGRS